MKKSVFAALLFVLVFSGCAQTSMIEKEQTTGDFYRSVNEHCIGKYAVLRLQDKEPLRVYNVNVGIDSTAWTDISSGKIKSVQTGKIYSVQVTDRAGGALSGLGYGILAGALAGGVYTAAVTGPTSHPAFPVSFGAIGGALTGAIVGPVIGVIIGRPSFFIINEKAE